MRASPRTSSRRSGRASRRRTLSTSRRASTPKPVPDVVGPGLQVLFCGINPSLRSGETGFHFARPGNRFWPALHLAGFTPVRLQPWEERRLLEYGCGITNLVGRSTASAAELRPEEFIAGRRRLERLVRRYRPRWVAVVGIGAYRTAFERPRATLGRQPETLGTAQLWVLPNPSGLNANHQLPDLAAAFRSLRRAAV